MRKFLNAGVAALTAAGAISATATPAAAQPRGGFHGGFHGGGWGGGYHHGYGGWSYGVAGLAGFALGAALASPYYYGPNYYYGPGYYGPGYGYGYGYGPGYYDYGRATCVGSRQVWDPYYGRWVWQRYYYGC
jgi:hypothetical protein